MTAIRAQYRARARARARAPAPAPAPARAPCSLLPLPEQFGCVQRLAVF